MNLKTKPKPVDLRKVTRHKLYPVINEYFKEIFADNPADEIPVQDALTLKIDLQARYNEPFNLKDVERILEAYGEETQLGAFIIRRSDFYLPGEESEASNG